MPGASSLGSGRPRSRLASLIPSTIAAAESRIVPSQSNTRQRVPLSHSHVLGLLHCRQISRQLIRRGAVNSICASVRDGGSAPRVQEHSPQPVALKLLVESEVAIFVVPGERETEICQMHPDLMGSAGLQFHLEQTGIFPTGAAA